MRLWSVFARMFRSSERADEDKVLVSCPVCGYLTIHRNRVDCPAYDICPICFWEDELWPGEENDLDSGGGPNYVTLGQARDNYRAFGAVEKRLIPYVRPPFANEKSSQ